MKFTLLSPKKILYQGDATSVTIPGSKGSFTVWEHHAAMITTIEKGEIVCRREDGEDLKFSVEGGFAEVRDNEISVCLG